LPEVLRQFLTPALWKQAEAARRRGAAPARRKPTPRWATPALVLTAVLMTWCAGDSQAERFEVAKAACVLCRRKRRRPGQTVQGFHKALARLPVAVLRTVAAGVRRQLTALLPWAESDGFVVFGCDGSLLECPRTAELEARLGDRGQEHSAPAIWVTALVHLRTGVLGAWRLGQSTAAERQHLFRLLPTLPAAALVGADAGFNGYWLAEAILQAGASFLIRASGKDTLYTDAPADREAWTEGPIWSWPQTAREQGKPPLRLRLIRVRSKRRKHDVWLVTNVLDPTRLPAQTAARSYAWRWENEGLFRTYKRTLNKVKLTARTVRLVPREAEGALLATQLLLAQGAVALPRRQACATPRRCSPRRVLAAIRRELQAAAGRCRRAAFSSRLAQARRERRPRTSAKEKRTWPRRAPHKAAKAPQLLPLPSAAKALPAKVEREAG
jgi:hypothetical protein